MHSPKKMHREIAQAYSYYGRITELGGAELYFVTRDKGKSKIISFPAEGAV